MGIKTWINSLLQPSVRWSVLALVGGGAALMLVAVIAFDVSMEMTGTEEFCTSCHEMRAGPYATLQQTRHFSNHAGVAASCTDCHLPKAFVPKMIRKIEASREVWGHLTGLLDSPEKYAAHAPAMKERELNRLRANNSQECRDCHQVERMVAELQSEKAQKFHRARDKNHKTCVDCHAGLAHGEDAASAMQLHQLTDQP